MERSADNESMLCCFAGCGVKRCHSYFQGPDFALDASTDDQEQGGKGEGEKQREKGMVDA